jgi:ketosteroid isomerase-like protein
MPMRAIEIVATSGDRILAVAHWREGQGPPGVDRVYNLLTMREGRILEMEDFFDGAAAQRAFSNPG